jgi:hypothetical protein
LVDDYSFQIKRMLGGLLSAGWTFDDILDLTWEQAALAAECVMSHKVFLLNMVSEPVMAALGTKFKKGRVSNRARRGQRDAARRGRETNPEAADAKTMLGIAAAGFGVEGG